MELVLEVIGDDLRSQPVWILPLDDVDGKHKHRLAAGLDVTFPPTNMPWNIREMHLRHPDGLVFRGGRRFAPEK